MRTCFCSGVHRHPVGAGLIKATILSRGRSSYCILRFSNTFSRYMTYNAHDIAVVIEIQAESPESLQLHYLCNEMRIQ